MLGVDAKEGRSGSSKPQKTIAGEPLGIQGQKILSLNADS